MYECDECGGLAPLVKCNANPEASEFYCEKCHKSVLVSEAFNQPE